MLEGDLLRLDVRFEGRRSQEGTGVIQKGVNIRGCEANRNVNIDCDTTNPSGGERASQRQRPFELHFRVTHAAKGSGRLRSDTLHRQIVEDANRLQRTDIDHAVEA